ncbi:hypothetical protein P7H25_24210 [Paenibacillus larvae]|nr:hypothetical protein [Paenibacillus larvae]MDT2258023.1 hypothetical protein [Paenibacillus larvae]
MSAVNLIGLFTSKRLIQDIFRYGQVVFRIRRRLVLLNGTGSQPKFLHDTSNGLLRDVNTLFFNAYHTFGLPYELHLESKKVLRIHRSSFATFEAFAFLAFRPFVITAFGNAEQSAHLRDTELEAVIMDEWINQRRSFAK